MPTSEFGEAFKRSLNTDAQKETINSPTASAAEKELAEKALKRDTKWLNDTRCYHGKQNKAARFRAYVYKEIVRKYVHIDQPRLPNLPAARKIIDELGPTFDESPDINAQWKTSYRLAPHPRNYVKAIEKAITDSPLKDLDKRYAGRPAKKQ